MARLLLDIGVAETEESLLRQAVSRGRELIGLDRIGIWKYDAATRSMLGTFGTDETGGLRDERESSYSIEPGSGNYPPQEVKGQLRDLVEESKRERKPAFRCLDGTLGDHKGAAVGRGRRAVATLWGGEAVRGFLFCDNLLNHGPIDDSQVGRLLVLAAGIGLNLDRIETLEKLNRAARELERKRMVAEEALRTKSKFISAMNHDLRTPLNTIFSPLDYLSDTDLNNDQKEMVMIARESAQQLLCIVENILDMAKIEEHRITVRPEEFGLRDFLRERLRPLENMAGTRDLYLRIDVAADVPEFLRSDKHLLARILVNLVGNAIKFTRCGGVTVKVRHSGQTLRIEVIDTKAGIPESDFERLFAAFEQIESTGAANDGTGLGLTICRELSKILGGGISVDSRKGEGSCFGLTLPLEDQPDRKPGIVQKHLFRTCGTGDGSPAGI